MEKIITQLRTKLRQMAFALFVVAWFSAGTVYGQSTSPAPYCSFTAPNMNAGTCTGSPYGFCLQTFNFNNGAINLNQTGACYGSSAADVYRYWTSKSTSVDAGASYTVVVSSPQGPGYNVSCGFWIDYNRNNTFDAAEFCGSKMAVNNTTGGPFHTITFTVPCNIVPGKTRMRAIAQYNTMVSAGGSCAAASSYGEAWDFDVVLNLPTSVAANFIAPSQAFIKTVVKFINANQSGYVEHLWDVDNNGSVEYAYPPGKSVDYSTISGNSGTWTTPGTKCVKLRSTNCLGKDSIVKCLTLVAPTVIPKADFIASKTTVEMYESVKLFDLSSDGPYIWQWMIYDSTTFKNELDPDERVSDENSGYVAYEASTSKFSQNPQVSFYREGTYCVELVATNGIGPSVIRKKCSYITVIPETKYYLGYGAWGPNQDNIVGSSKGTVIDDGGQNGKYANDQGYGTRSYLQITPCNAKKITLTMTQLRMKDGGDVLKVFDGKNDKGTLLASWSSNDKAIKTVTATSGSMFLLFNSDAGGQDSGYLGTYTSELGAPTPPNPSFYSATDPGYNGTPLKFFNTTSNISGVPTWEWTVDGVQTGKGKNMQYRFFSDGTYEVCLEISSCVGKAKSCQFIDIITPQLQSKVDFSGSNLRPTIGVDRTTLTPHVDNANRFMWTVFPTTYTLMNPPANPSKSGTGFINYKDCPGDSFPTPVLKFTASGCYTITLRAWNDLDSTATVKTIVKNKYICALDYCKPSAYILSADVAINRVRVLDGSTELINNFTTSGVSAYTDYTTTNQATLTFGRTYSVEVSRTTTIDPANRMGWVDWNIDGDFSDAGEQVFIESSSQSPAYTATFTVPHKVNSFEGLTRLRIAANYNNYTTNDCGPLQAGEYEDYGLILKNDNQVPTITLNGSDTVRVEKCFPYVDLGAVAMDGSEGDISNRMGITSDLDSCTTGIYTIEYNVTDASGNKAIPVRRTIIIVLDKTPPILTLNPGGTGCIEAKRINGPYSDPGATAIDPKNNTDLRSAIIVTGSVNTKKVGIYVLTYTVQDVAGNVTVQTRTVCVADTKGPDIDTLGETRIQILSTWIDKTTVKDDYDDNPVITKNWGSNGPVNTQERGPYPVTYTATDATGNNAAPKSRIYRVDDFIPPTINLNTLNTVYHEVRTPYVSVAPEASDNYYPSTQVSLTQVPGPGVDANKLGTYSEVFEAIDGSLNVTRKTRTVIVQDTKAPSVWGEIIHACVGTNIDPWWNVSTKDNYNSPSQLKPFLEIINHNVDPTNEGTYTITYRVTDLSGNVSDEFTRLVVYTYWPRCKNSDPTWATGVDQVTSAEDKVKVYPNPSTGAITIDLQGEMAKNATVSVYNAMGQLVMSNTYTEAMGKYNVNLSNQATGVYTIKLIADGTVITKRVTLVN